MQKPDPYSAPGEFSEQGLYYSNGFEVTLSPLPPVLRDQSKTGGLLK